jgi:hypothetical protein
MAQNIFHGARAQLVVNGKVIGLFTQVSYGVNYDVVPSFILGRFSPAEITYTGSDAVSVSASGYRVIGAGPYSDAGQVPLIQDLLNFEDISLSLYDRQTNQLVMTVVGVKPVGFNESDASRAISTMTITFMGQILSTEGTPSAEGSGASDILSGT